MLYSLLVQRIVPNVLVVTALLAVAGFFLPDLWLRGGFPDSFQAASDAASLRWREDFLRTYLERDIPALGPRIPSATLRRFWTMLAHVQGGLMNAAALATGLGISGQSVGRYLDLFADLEFVELVVVILRRDDGLAAKLCHDVAQRAARRFGG